MSFNSNGNLTASGEFGATGAVNVFGAYASKSTGTSYQADTDGMVVAWVDADDDGDAGGLDGRTGPTTGGTVTRCQCYNHWFTSDKIYVYTASISFPVAKGQWWRVDTSTRAGTPVFYVWWVPFGTTL
jgi:hypothetical protein